jgi:hypothetical protein
MAEPHDVLEILRRARPDIPGDLVSPADPAAQALLQEILSMPDTAAPEVASQAPVPLARARGHHRRLAAGSAAAALIVAALLAAGLLVLAPISSTEASPLAAAAEKTAAALRQSGRADATVSIDYAGERGQPGHRALGVLRRGHLDRPRLRHCPRHRPDPELRRRRVVLLPADLRQPHVAVDPPQRSARGRDAGR